MKNLSIIIILTLSIFQGLNLNAQADKPTNYLVILDLSDRLLATHQAEKDLKAISMVYQSFIKSIKQKNIINAKDRFKIKIVHQPGTTLNESAYQQFLELDLSKISALNRISAVAEFDRKIGTVLRGLYKEAILGSRPSDYSGVDLWRFFNERLPLELRANMHNEIVILNDGYFDYESKTHPALKKGNRSTNSSFYRVIRGNNWKATMENGDYGILITSGNFKQFDAKIGIVGLNPKENTLTELDMLKGTWNKWMNEIGFSEIYLIENQNDSNTITHQLAINLN
jgi:hypothetical protein